MSDAVAQSPESSQVDKQIRIESLLFLYRSMPSAALGHTLAGGFITFALYDVVDRDTLFFWLAAIITVGIIRLVATNLLQRRLTGLSEASVNTWAQLLAGMTFVQTSLWGLSVFLIWPDDIAYRSVLIAILAGIIAAGGIMLALHRRSFWIYCLPISVPTVIQLVIGGTELELVLAALLVFYSGILLVSVNRLTNVFLEMLRLRFLMQSESRTDALTGLANRRGFDESLHDLWQQSIRSSQSLGLLSIDIDYFKNYNDYYGHPQGDVALKSFADMLKRVVSRSTDVCARVGGEEFAVIMPTTDLEGSTRVAKFIQQELAKLHIPHRNCERGILTVSIGVNVASPDRSTSFVKFVEQTDQALYRAKESGRNTVSIADR